MTAWTLPTVTTPTLVEELLRTDAVTNKDLSTLFGEKRHGVSLNEFEMAVVRSGLVPNPVLLAAKAAVSGRDVVDAAELSIRPDLIDRRVAKLAGALAITWKDRPAVAFVEDTTENLQFVIDHLGTDTFDVVLVTAPQFQQLFLAAYGAPKDRDVRPEARDIYEILDECVSRGASDVHLSVGQPPMLRIDGRLVQMQRQPLDSGWLFTQVRDLVGDERIATWQERHDADMGVSYGDARFRVNIGQDRSGLILVARRLPTDIPSPDDLGLPASVRKLCELDRGLIVVTGPTGSGKTTTLASLLTQIANPNGGQGRHVITLEDPVEYLIPGGPSSLIRQRELGRDFNDFPAGLRQALRQDPDVILVGELRDAETTRVAIQAAETGHLVLSTVHTYDAATTVSRLVGQYPEGEQPQIRAQLSYILRGVVSQTLIPRLSGKGRVAAFEVMLGTPAVAANLRRVDGATALRQIIETSAADGMQTIDMHLAQLVRAGTISTAEAESRSRDVDALRKRLNLS